MSESESSSSCSDTENQPYIPTSTDETLMVDDRFYKILETINVDWPSQTIAMHDSAAYIATNPADKSPPAIIRIDFAQTSDFQNLKKLRFDKVDTKTSINRLRIQNEQIYAISDKNFEIFDLSGKFLFKNKHDYSYGLLAGAECFVGCTDGVVRRFDQELNFFDRKIHTKAVESICTHEQLIISGSCDQMVNAFDKRAKETLNVFENDYEVNSVDIKNSLLIFGDDSGKVKAVDIRKPGKMLEQMEIHKTPISMVRWFDGDEFYSLSDEKVCLWSTDLDTEWEHHKWLRFIHAGHKFYKDVDFHENVILTTSQDGICVFQLNLDEQVDGVLEEVASE